MPAIIAPISAALVRLKGAIAGAPVPYPGRATCIYAACVGAAGLLALVFFGVADTPILGLAGHWLLWCWIVAFVLAQRLNVRFGESLNISFEEVYLIPIVLVLSLAEASFVLIVAPLLTIAAGGRWGWINTCWSFAVTAATLFVSRALLDVTGIQWQDSWQLAPVVLALVVIFDILIFEISVYLTPGQSVREFLRTIMPSLFLQLTAVLPLATLACLAAIANEPAALLLLFVPFVTLRVVGARLVDAARLRSSAQVRSQAIRVAAHELRTPLTTISGFAQTLVAVELNKEQQAECLRTIASQALRMESIINDLLVYSRLTSDVAQIMMETVELQSVAHSALEAVGADGRIQVHVPSGLTVSADRVILERALINLLSNACKYAPEGPILLRANLDESRQSVSLEVWDEGPGVPEDFAPRLFTEFARSDEARKSSEPGTGLGLAIVRASMRIMGAEAYYRPRSSVDASATGSIFGLRLRRVETNVAQLS